MHQTAGKGTVQMCRILISPFFLTASERPPFCLRRTIWYLYRQADLYKYQQCGIQPFMSPSGHFATDSALPLGAPAVDDDGGYCDG